jgi:hypothetical protein
MKTKKTLWTLAGALSTCAILAFTFVFVPAVMAQTSPAGEIDTVAVETVVTETPEVPAQEQTDTSVSDLTDINMITQEQAFTIAKEKLLSRTGDFEVALGVTCAGEPLISGTLDINNISYVVELFESADPVSIPVYSFVFYIDMEAPFNNLGVGMIHFSIDINAFTGEEFIWTDENESRFCYSEGYAVRIIDFDTTVWWSGRTGNLSDVLDELYPDLACICAGQPEMCAPA